MSTPRYTFLTNDRSNNHSEVALKPIGRWPSSRLPTEIYERIIDAVADLARGKWLQVLGWTVADLPSCTLVCRTWLPRSRYHLYHHVRLDGTSRTRQFIFTMSTSILLGNHVIELTLDAYVEPWQKPTVPDFNWIYQAASVLSPHLKNLDVLRFRGLPLLHPTFPIRLSTFVTIKKLVIDSFDGGTTFGEVVRFIGRFPQLRHLAIHWCTWRQPVSYLTRQQCQLSSLYVEQPGIVKRDIIRWLFPNCTEATPSLTELVFRDTSQIPQSDWLESTWSLRDVLPSHLLALRKLTLDMSFWPDLGRILGESSTPTSTIMHSYQIGALFQRNFLISSAFISFFPTTPLRLAPFTKFSPGPPVVWKSSEFTSEI